MKQALFRVAAVLGVSGVLVAASMHAPALLRRIDAFAVQHVEVSGTRYLAAEAAVAAAGLTGESNIFDDPAAWLEALSRHPLVRSARIERRVPNTLRLVIEESRPVAFARTPELRPVDETGRVLPADPAADGMDLPVLLVQTRVSAGGWAADPETRRIASFLGLAGRLEPSLLGWVSEVGVHGDAIRLVLRGATDADVLVPAEPTAERLRELNLTLADLSMARYAAAAAGSSNTSQAGSQAGRDAAAASRGSELSRVKRIDGRFHDQVVVAMHRGRN